MKFYTPAKLLSLSLICATALSVSACSTGIVPTGGNTYMVAHSGSNLTHEASLKAKCYEDANAFCSARGLDMVPVSTTGRDGEPHPFGRGASCELVFKAVVKGSPEDVQPATVPDTQL
jgi:hypothetical protein